MAQLAGRIGLSTTPCWNRLKRTEKHGYIEAYLTADDYDYLVKVAFESSIQLQTLFA